MEKPLSAVCVQCGDHFEAKLYWQRFCSGKCRDRCHYLQKKEKRNLAQARPVAVDSTTPAPPERRDDRPLGEVKLDKLRNVL